MGISKYGECQCIIMSTTLRQKSGVVDGIGLLDTSGVAAYMWTMDYDAANGYLEINY